MLFLESLDMLPLLEDEVQGFGDTLSRDGTPRGYPREPVHARWQGRLDTVAEGAFLGQLVREPGLVQDFSWTLGADVGLELVHMPNSFWTEAEVV